MGRTTTLETLFKETDGIWLMTLSTNHATNGRPLRVGLIGAGAISGSHLPAYRDFPEQVTLSAVCDAHGPNAAKVAEEFNLATYYTDYETMISEAPIDAVDICLPHHMHYPVAMAALEAGKHVLVEKPFAISMSECEELVDAAENAGLTLMVAQVQRYTSTYRGLKLLIDRGELGPIHHGRIDGIQNLHDYAEPPHWLYDGKTAGGGGVISVLVHRIDLLRYLLGDARRVTAFGKQVDPAFQDAEDYAVALIEFENGALVDVFSCYSAAALPYSEMFWLFGENAVVHTLPREGMWDNPQPRIAYRNGTKSGRTFTDVALEAGKDSLPTDQPFVNEILHFAECVATGKEPLSSGRDNLGTMAIIFAIYESMRQGGTPIEVKRTR